MLFPAKQKTGNRYNEEKQEKGDGAPAMNFPEQPDCACLFLSVMVLHCFLKGRLIFMAKIEG